jgi:hypothetical protein
VPGVVVSGNHHDRHFRHRGRHQRGTRLGCQARGPGSAACRIATAKSGCIVRCGVTLIVVTFDGYGDSGQIENIEVKAGDAVMAMPAGDVEIAEAIWDQPEPNRSTVSVADAIERLAYDLLERIHCGWENNDRTYGDFTFDVAERTITFDYNERYTPSEYSQPVF